MFNYSQIECFKRTRNFTEVQHYRVLHIQQFSLCTKSIVIDYYEEMEYDISEEQNLNDINEEQNA